MTGAAELLLPVVAAVAAATAVLAGGVGRAAGHGGASGTLRRDRTGVTPEVSHDDPEPPPPRLRDRVRLAARAVAHRVRGPGPGPDTELQVLDGLAAALHAGLPVPQAVTLAVAQAGTAAPDAHHPAAEWEELSRAATQGQALAPVWHRLARRTGSPTLASVARAWAVAALTGAPLAQAIRVAAHTSRERRRLERAVQVATAGARATVSVLTLLPLAGVGLAAALGVAPTALYAHPLSLASAGAGATLLLVGQVWSRHLVARVLRGTS